MKVYGSYTSPFVRHVRIALAQLKSDTGLDCEFIETDQNGSAQLAPTKRIPLLIDGDLQLNDSASILMHLRQKAGQAFITDVRDYDLFCMVNTLLEASVHLFYLERFDQITPANSSYMQRHSDRVDSILAELNQRELPTSLPLTDGQLRLACFLDWALFRERISLAGLDNLQAFLELARSWPEFAKTAPPAGA